jgi:thiamine transport system permease protein
MRVLRSLLPILLFLVLLGIPLAGIARRALVDPSALPEGFSSTVASIASFTALQAALSTLASIAIGIPLGAFYARRWHPAVAGFSTATFALPSIVAVGTISLLLRGTELRFGLPAVVLAHAFLNAPWIALATAEGIRSLPRAWISAARSLGASPAKAFVRIESPWIARRVALAAAQVFGLCAMSFAIVLLLGGGPPVSTLETEIYASVRGGGLALSAASLFALAQLLLALAPLAAILALRSRRRFATAGESASLEEVRAAPARWSGALVALAWFAVPGIALFAAFPEGRAFAVLAGVLRDEEWRTAATTSFRIALASGAAICALGAIFAWGASAYGGTAAVSRLLSALPAGVSPLVLCLGFFLAYSRWIDPFEGSEAGMIAVQATLLLPFALRALLPLVEEASGGWRRKRLETARTLGATPSRAWRALEWPRWRRAFRHLFRLAFVWSFADVAAASFFGSERLRTIGMVFVGWIGQYRFDDVNAGIFWIYLLSAVALVSGARRAEPT